MRDVRKVSASAGADWLLGGFRLLRQSPFGLGLLGAIYGVVALLVSVSAESSMTAFLLLEVALVLAGPLLIGGLVFAARSVDRGGNAVPAQLLQGVHDGKVARLLATLLPQILALVLCALLLVALIGGDGLAQLAQTLEHLQGQAKPDPALVAALPVGRLFLWLLLVCVIGILAGFFTFVAVPEIMFTGNGALEAMQRSFRACVRNLPALIVFFVLTMIAAFAIYFMAMLLGFVVRLLAGDLAMQVVLQLVSMAVLMPVLTGAMYHAWRQMLGGDATAASDPVVGGFEA
jgi:uncharacterized membrane protein